MNERVVALAGLHDDVATFAAVPAGWPSARNILLTPERETAVTAFPGLHTDCGLVNKHCCLS
jgi:hypothetical protein